MSAGVAIDKAVKALQANNHDARALDTLKGGLFAATNRTQFAAGFPLDRQPFASVYFYACEQIVATWPKAGVRRGWIRTAIAVQRVLRGRLEPVKAKRARPVRRDPDVLDGRSLAAGEGRDD
ncbi:MAG: hypothetical protein AAGF20_00815 [Pseudomonadota bacterium]